MKNNQFKSRRPHYHRCSGVSLIEILVVVTIIGIISVVGLARFAGGTSKVVAAESDARRLALDLRQAQRRAISTGDNHYLLFDTTSGFTTYTLYRRASGGDVAVDEPRTISSGVTGVTSHTVTEYTFEGKALAGYTIAFNTSIKNWFVTVIPATGYAKVTHS